MIKPVFLFDIGNVMINFDQGELEARISKASGISGPHVYASRARDDLVAVETGQMSGMDYFIKLKESLVLDWSYDDWIRLWMDVYTMNAHGRNLFLELKRAGYSVCTLSNQADFNRIAIERKFPGFFQESTANFLSFEMGLHKPDARIYTRVCESLGVSPTDCTFLDDAIENVNGAQSVGMRAILFSKERFAQVVKEIEEITGHTITSDALSF